MMLFLRRERCGRLIEDDDFGVETHRPRDLDHLALRGAERLDGRRGVDGEVEGLKKLLRLDIGAPQAIVEFLVAQIEILRDGQRRDKTGLLVDHRDPVPPRKRGTSDLDAIAGEANFARRGRDHAGQDLDQRRLAGPVLSDDRVDLAAAKLEIDIFQRGDAPIFLGDLSHFQKRSFGKRGVSGSGGSVMKPVLRKSARRQFRRLWRRRKAACPP